MEHRFEDHAPRGWLARTWRNADETFCRWEFDLANRLLFVDLADQVFVFKRTAREAALRHKMYTTFMAKPHAREPGSAMHVHQSVVDKKTRQNVFSNKDGSPSQLFFSHIAGLQKYLPAAMCLFAPNVNSYRRITRHYSAPINTQWGYDNRTAGLRVPTGEVADFPTNTSDALTSGGTYAITGAIERMHRHLTERCGRTPLTLVTGGAGWKVAPWLAVEHELVESLIFDGLLVVASERERVRSIGK